MKHWRFLPICPEDLESVATIEVQSFENPWEHQSIRAELANPASRAFILSRQAETARPIVGAYIFNRILMDEVHIMKVAVAPEQRRRGLATRLTVQALSEARREGCHRAILEVRVSNSAAIRLYTQLGFKKIGERKRYYRPGGEDALVMSKNLEEAS